MVSRGACMRWALLTCRTMRWPSVSSNSSPRTFRARTVSPTSMAWTWPVTRCAPWWRSGRWVVFCRDLLGMMQGYSSTSQLLAICCLTAVQSPPLFSSCNFQKSIKLKAPSDQIISEGFAKKFKMAVAVLSSRFLVWVHFKDSHIMSVPGEWFCPHGDGELKKIDLYLE